MYWSISGNVVSFFTRFLIGRWMHFSQSCFQNLCLLKRMFKKMSTNSFFFFYIKEMFVLKKLLTCAVLKKYFCPFKGDSSLKFIKKNVIMQFIKQWDE